MNGEMEDRREDETVEMKNALLIMNKECQELKMENSHLKEQVNALVTGLELICLSCFVFLGIAHTSPSFI